MALQSVNKNWSLVWEPARGALADSHFNVRSAQCTQLEKSRHRIGVWPSKFRQNQTAPEKHQWKKFLYSKELFYQEFFEVRKGGSGGTTFAEMWDSDCFVSNVL